MPRLLRFIIMKAADSPSIVGGIERRLSSPSGMRSTLTTSAPMSASMSVQVGPAMTWVRSITFRPSSGPISTSPALLTQAYDTNAKFAIAIMADPTYRRAVSRRKRNASPWQRGDQAWSRRSAS